MAQRVDLAIYDLSGGLAAQLSSSMGALLNGKQVDLVPHTGVRVFGHEFVFSGGIRMQAASAIEASMGRAPVRVEALGTTTKTAEELQTWLFSVADQWTADSRGAAPRTLLLLRSNVPRRAPGGHRSS